MLLIALAGAAPAPAEPRAKEGTMELPPRWEYVADTVMGGVSTGGIGAEVVQGRDAVRLTGRVSLENDGGFIQMALDLPGDVFDAGGWTGVELEVLGNGARYDLRLRTTDLTRPWQSYRADFAAPARWTTIRIPFVGLEPHRTDAPFDPRRLRRLGVLAVGRAFDADVAVAGIRLYR